MTAADRERWKRDLDLAEDLDAAGRFLDAAEHLEAMAAREERAGMPWLARTLREWARDIRINDLDEEFGPLEDLPTSPPQEPQPAAQPAALPWYPMFGGLISLFTVLIVEYAP